ATTNRQQTEERASTSSTSTSNVATMKSKTQSPVGVSSPSAVKDPVVFSRRSRFAPLQPTPPPAPAPDFERRCNPSPPAAVTTDCLPDGARSSNSIPVKEFQRATPKRQTELRRIMQRRKSMILVSSKPLVKEQELFGGSSLDYEDLVETQARAGKTRKTAG
ncbi:hypothetical protein ACLKA6_001072, partial [Drosophila palustris]